MDMTAAIGFEEFKKQADIIHHNRFKYVPSSYTNTRGSIKFFDPVTNDNYEQRIVNHLKGSLPRELQKKEFADKSQSEFIINAASVHNGFYSYEHVEYINNQTKVLITCPKHGDFLQKPNDHLSGHGCPSCKSEKRVISEEEFISRARQVHGDKFDYSQLDYKNIISAVNIICPKHGMFTTTGRIHLRSDCPKCSKDKEKVSIGEFKQRLFNRHGDKYSVIEDSYDGMKSPARFICSKHGEYEYLPFNCLNVESAGCKECKRENSMNDGDQVLELVKLKHRNKFNYSKFKYSGMNYPCIVTCIKHGDIETTPYKLLIQEYGCLRCSQESVGERSLLNEEGWRPRLIELHPNLDFSESVYNGYDNPIEFKCPIHGKQFRIVGHLFQGYGCQLCSKETGMNRYETEIYNFLKSVYDGEIVIQDRSVLNGRELDFYIPEHNLAIEFNGIAFHHSSKDLDDKFLSQMYRDKNYHYRKLIDCKNKGITLISIPDFYWIVPNKKEIIKNKIKHYLKMDERVFARKCYIAEISNEVANIFYNLTHIEGAGFKYRDQESYGLFHNGDLVMCVSIGYIYNQSSKRFEAKVNRISTESNTTVVGGLTKLLKFLKNKYGTFKYDFTMSFGASTIDNFEYQYIGPRYFWVNKTTLKYYHRNHCQKHLLEKHFNEPLLDNDTESTYMQRLGFLKYYDCGIGQIIF